jgi:hypothetical protein
MSTRVRKDLICDRCGYSLAEQNAAEFREISKHTIGWQRIVAKIKGWRIRFNGLDYCAGCWPDVIGLAMKPLTQGERSNETRN